MKIYHSPFSSNARKVLVTATYLGVGYDPILVDLPKREQRSPEYLALNPNGKVPVLVDGDFVLSESHAIMAYLADKTPGNALYPTDLRVRADVHRWMFWCSNHWAPAIATLNFERMVKQVLNLGAPDAAQVAHAEATFRDFGKVLDAHLAKRDWLVGKDVTLADIAVATPLMVAKGAALPVGELANVEKWFERYQGLDAWKKVASAFAPKS